MATKTSTSSGSPLKQLDDTLELYLVKKAPAIPDNIKEVIVKFGPWLTLLMLILALPAVLALLGLGAILAPASFLGGANAGVQYIASMVVMVVTLVLEAIAIPGLMKRTKQGWTFMYYSTLVGVISNIISFNIGGLIIGTLLSLYILFQVKSYYK